MSVNKNKMITKYIERIKFLLYHEGAASVEVDHDFTVINESSESWEALCVHASAGTQSNSSNNMLTVIIFYPLKFNNVNDFKFFGINKGMTLSAIENGLSEEFISSNVKNLIELDGEQNAVNFLLGKSFLRKHESSVPYVLDCISACEEEISS